MYSSRHFLPILKNSEFLGTFSKTLPKSYFTEIRPSVYALIQARIQTDGRTGVTKLTITFHVLGERAQKLFKDVRRKISWD